MSKWVPPCRADWGTDIKIEWLFGGCFEQTHESIGFGRKLRFRYRNKSHNSPEPANNSSANAKQGEKGL